MEEAGKKWDFCAGSLGVHKEQKSSGKCQILGNQPEESGINWGVPVLGRAGMGWDLRSFPPGILNCPDLFPKMLSCIPSTQKPGLPHKHKLQHQNHKTEITQKYQFYIEISWNNSSRPGWSAGFFQNKPWLFLQNVEFHQIWELLSFIFFGMQTQASVECKFFISLLQLPPSAVQTLRGVHINICSLNKLRAQPKVCSQY